MIRIYLRFCDAVVCSTLKVPNRTTTALREPPSFAIAVEERVPQDIVGEVLAQGIWITRARRYRGQKLVGGIRALVSLSRKKCERTACM